jgi:molybdopterin synthase sulfur carrier subunit
MAKIKLKVYGLFREKSGVEETELTGENFLEILNSLIKNYPILRNEIFDENMKLKENVYLLNGRNIFLLEGVETKVKEGDTIAVFPIITGG